MKYRRGLAMRILPVRSSDKRLDCDNMEERAVHLAFSLVL